MDISWSVLTVLLWTLRSLPSVSADLRHTRMTNGSYAINENFPFVVKVNINEVNCTGFILDKRFVATGRQCIGDFRKLKSESYHAKIYAGIKSMKSPDYINDNIQTVRVISAYCYSEDNKANQLRDDLCLLKVFPRFMWTSTVSQARLPQKSEWFQTKSCKMVGFGESFDGDNSWTLKTATLDVKHPRACASVNKSEHMERLLCSNCCNNVIIPCRGDVGAPLVCNNHVVAILQGNEKRACGKPGEDLVFIYLPPYLRFIETVLWSQPERFRVRLRSSAVSYRSDSKSNVGYYILLFFTYKLTLEKNF